MLQLENIRPCLSQKVIHTAIIFQKRGDALPVSAIIDPIDRTVDFKPPKGQYNPRNMICGREEPGKINWSFSIFPIYNFCYYDFHIEAIKFKINILFFYYSIFFRHNEMGEWTL